MKHPALTRVFAVALAVLCLVMLLAGVLGLRSAGQERQRALEDAGRLRDRAGQYASALAAIERGKSLDELNETLSRHQREHDRLASRHRTDMALYTATQSGLRTGAYALDQADALFAEGKRQYEEGLALFEEQAAAFAAQYEQFQQSKAQLAGLVTLYESAMVVLENAEGHAQNAHGMAELLDSEDPDARLGLTLAAYDGALAAVDQLAASLQTLQELIPILDSLTEMDLGSLEGLSALSELSGCEVEMPEIDMEQLTQVKEIYDALWPRIKPMIEEMGVLTRAAEGAIQSATGKSPAELRADAQARRDAIAAGDAENPLSDEEFEPIRAVYGATKNEILSALTVGDELLAILRAYAEPIGPMLSTTLEQLVAAEEMMEQGKAAIEEGRAGLEAAGEQMKYGEEQLYNSRAMIWYQMGQQREKAAALQVEKERLDVEAEQLKALQERADARKELEQNERSLRLMLLKRDAVAELNEAGLDIESAAVQTAQRIEDEAEYNYEGRSLAYYLLIAGGVCGFLGLPAAFERTKSRFCLLAPVLLCLLCAIGSEAVCLHLGRGSSYSALGGAIFALFQLLVSAPKAKNKA